MRSTRQQCRQGWRRLCEFAQREAMSITRGPLQTVELFLFKAATVNAKLDALKAELQTVSLF